VPAKTVIENQQVYVVTDTVAQLPADVVQQLGIEVVPAAVIHCDGRDFIDGVDITPADAYRLLAQNPSEFRTASIPQQYFSDAFIKLSAITQQILCITLSSKLSSVYQVALQASQETTDRIPDLTIRVVDSLSASGGQGLTVLTAARFAAAGHDIDAATAIAEEVRENAECLFVLDTLTEIHRSGRIPKVAAQAVGILNVKPVLRLFRDGKVHFVALARNRRKGLRRILDLAAERTHGELVDVMIGHTAVPDEAEALKNSVRDKLNCHGIFVSEFSPVMGYAIGPGVLGIAFCPHLDAESQT